MNAAETIAHFTDMGCFDRVCKDAKGEPILIMGSSTPPYAIRCMRDFRELPGYYEGAFGIDAVTTDGVKVSMTFV